MKSIRYPKVQETVKVLYSDMTEIRSTIELNTHSGALFSVSIGVEGVISSHRGFLFSSLPRLCEDHTSCPLDELWPRGLL